MAFCSTANRLECTSCHDVHNQEGTPFDIVKNPKLVKIVGVDGQGKGSLLCRSCHNK
jgi:ABC-type metal ion transport system substrate-binding protein